MSLGCCRKSLNGTGERLRISQEWRRLERTKGCGALSFQIAGTLLAGQVHEQLRERRRRRNCGRSLERPECCCSSREYCEFVGCSLEFAGQATGAFKFF